MFLFFFQLENEISPVLPSPLEKYVWPAPGNIDYWAIGTPEENSSDTHVLRYHKLYLLNSVVT